MAPQVLSDSGIRVRRNLLLWGDVISVSDTVKSVKDWETNNTEETGEELKMEILDFCLNQLHASENMFSVTPSTDKICELC